MPTNLDFQNDGLRSIFWIICAFSWLSFILTNAIALLKLVIRNYEDEDKRVSYNIIWGFLTYYIKKNFYLFKYFPIEWENYYLSTIFLIIFFLSIIAFGFFLYKTYFQREDYVFNGLFGTYSRYHFIPLICGTCLFLSGIIKNSFFRGFGEGDIKPKEYFDAHLSKYVSDLIFSFIGVVSLTFIKKTIKLEQPFYIVYIIKDGFFSILLALYTYSFFYASAYIGFLNQFEKCIKSGKHTLCNENNSNAVGALKNCAIAFSLLVGIVNLGIAGYLKDFIISLMNAVIYLGLLIFFYSIKGERKKKMDPPFIEGIFDLIVFCCSLVGIAYIIYLRWKNPNNYKKYSTETPLNAEE